MGGASSRAFAALVIAAVTLGCPRGNPAPEVVDAGPGPGAVGFSPPPAPRPVVSLASLALLQSFDGGVGIPEGVHSTSRRCGQCHSRAREEWSVSAHAQAANAEAYLRAVDAVPVAQRAACAGCHVPLEGATARIAGEGVACDACHTAAGSGAGAAALKLVPELATKFGPYKDAKDHSFHRVAYSDFVTGSELCVSCHQDRVAGPVPIYTTGAEWKASGASQVSCQSCHMPTLHDEAATGAGPRAVSRHDFGVDRAVALGNGIQMGLKIGLADHPEQFSVILRNDAAGHALPTGSPEKRLRLTVEGVRDGQVTAIAERIFGRTLVDAQGKPAPSFRAVKQTADTRLAAGAVWEQPFALPKKGSQLVVRLWYDPTDPAFAAELGARESVLVFERRVPSR